MTPEEKARIKIDQWFADAGWKVVNREDYEPTCTAVAIREGLLKGNLEADYFLFINGKAVGVLEAKREETDAFASKVCEQAALYARSVPNIYQAYQKPLPFIFTSNGKELYCCDFREQDFCFKQIMNIPTPHELVKRLGIEDAFAGLPTLKKKGLRDCQYEAVTELEKSFRSGQNRALMVLATGAGKTYAACLATYRMLSYTPMRRVLFLVDRNNLGKQVEGEFGTFRLTENGDAFNTIFTVNRLRSSSIPSDSNVVISTIQRLFSFLKGETIEDNDDDENEPIEEVTLPPNPNLPHDYFDMIIIDECHRSIYGNWRKVLEYFDTARLVGLTATPIPETMAFFNNNCKEKDYYVQVYIDDELLVKEENEYSRMYSRISGVPTTAVGEAVYHITKAPYKLLLMTESSDFAAAWQDVANRFDRRIDVTSSKDNFLELMEPAVNKWVAVKELAESFGIKPDEIMCIGDSNNDISMIANAGIGVAVANAKPQVQQAAKLITASNDNDGVALAIENILTRQAEINLQ